MRPTGIIRRTLTCSEICTKRISACLEALAGQGGQAAVAWGTLCRICRTSCKGSGEVQVRGEGLDGVEVVDGVEWAGARAAAAAAAAAAAEEVQVVGTGWAGVERRGKGEVGCALNLSVFTWLLAPVITLVSQDSEIAVVQ